MPERRAEKDNRSRLDAIHADYLRFSRRVALTLTIMGAVLIFGLAATAYVLDNERENSDQIRVIAERADDRAEGARTLAVLRAERVCTETSDRSACQALFDRLYRSVSAAQRRQLACALLEELDGPTIRRLRRETGCS